MAIHYARTNIDPDLYEWVKEQAKANRRTIKGQLDLIIAKAKEREENERKVRHA
jgi:hypothetical protein